MVKKEESSEEMKKAAGEEKESEGEKTKVKPGWIKMKPEEMEKIIVDLAKEGETPAKIGAILRDKYGVPNSKLFGKKITGVLREKKVKYKGEKDILDDKVGKLRSHILKHKHDYGASKSLTKKLWVLNKFDKLSIN